MKVIFNVSPHSSELKVYIHCETAAELYKMNDKLYSHSEYTSKWDGTCEEWRNKEWYNWCTREDMSGSSSVITVLTFYTSYHKFKDEFIKELSNYLSESWSQDGAHFVKWQLFDKKD